jgi:2-oxoisovalerate dehydrogenase E1 component
MFGGVASDLAMIMEECFKYLDAPVKRVASFRHAYTVYKSTGDILPKGQNYFGHF